MVAVEALDALKAGLDDVDALFRRPGLFGWQDSNPCAGAAAAPGTGLWTGQACRNQLLCFSDVVTNVIVSAHPAVLCAGVTCDYTQQPPRVSML